MSLIFGIKHSKFEFWVEFEVRHALFKRFKSWIELYIRYLRYWLFYIQNLKSIGCSVSTVFLKKAIFDKSAHQDPHFFHIQMGPSVNITPHGDLRGGGVTLICSSYVCSGPASTVHPPKYQEFQAPQKYSSYPPKIHPPKISRISSYPPKIFIFLTPPPQKKKNIYI